MSLNFNALGDPMRDAVVVGYLSDEHKADRTEVFRPMAQAIMDETQANASVSVTVATTGTASAQTGTGTGTVY